MKEIVIHVKTEERAYAEALQGLLDSMRALSQQMFSALFPPTGEYVEIEARRAPWRDN